MCRLSLVGKDGSIAETQSEIISGKFETSRWPDGVVVAERYALSLEPSLPAGEYQLLIAVMDAASGQALDSVEQTISIGDGATLLTPALETISLPVNATFGHNMRLIGCTPRQEGTSIVLELYWQALQAMETDYKIFVHLLHPESGLSVAQRDVMPRDWSYPTSLWARQEVFVDRLALDVTGVSPGTYKLAVGVYEPEGERLVARNASGHLVPDNRVIVDGTVKVTRP